MKVIGKIHEILIRRIDKENPESDYYELYPITVTDAVYLSEDRDQTLGEFLTELETNFSSFVENINFPITSVQVFDGTQFGPIKTGDVILTAKDFGLDRIDNTPDAEKPVSEPQKTFITSYITNISQMIGSTLDNIDTWNAHLTDYNNPHRVTWEQVTPEGIDINPENLVDETVLSNAIKEHNESTDLSTLHPSIIEQIHDMQNQLLEIERLIGGMSTNIDDTLDDVVQDAINEHNEDPMAHPDILRRLTELSLEINNVVQEYSGLTGAELLSNKVNEINLPALVAASPGDNSSPLATQYPSMLALKDFMDKLKVSTFENVEYIENATQAQVDVIKDGGGSGILFVDNLDGVKGTHILVYQNGQWIVKYNLPAPASNFEVYTVAKAPTEQFVRDTYGDRNVLLLCERSFASPDTGAKYNQSICIYSKRVMQEWVLDKPVFEGETNIWNVICANDNKSFNFASGFPSGRGLLFVDSLYMQVPLASGGQEFINTGRPGVVLYTSKVDNINGTVSNMEYKCIPLGGNTRNVIMKEYATQPTAEVVKNTLFPPDGTGIVYVNNMYTSTSGVPGFEVWHVGEKKFEKPLMSVSQEQFEFSLTGTGGAVSRVFNLAKSYNAASLRAIVVLGGFNTNSITTGRLTATASVTNITESAVTVSTTVTNGMWAKFIVTVVGTLK